MVKWVAGSAIRRRLPTSKPRAGAIWIALRHRGQGAKFKAQRAEGRHALTWGRCLTRSHNQRKLVLTIVRRAGTNPVAASGHASGYLSLRR